MSRKTRVWSAIALLAVAMLNAGCGSTDSTGASSATLTPAISAPGPSSSSSGSTPGPTDSVAGGTATGVTSASTSPVRVLPTNAGQYGQLLIDAWSRGDRTTAARVATPAAVSQIFAHRPVADLVNYSCENGNGINGVICGWIGDRDTRVQLWLNPAAVTEGKPQAITKVLIGLP